MVFLIFFFNATNKENETALILASRYGHLEVVKYIAKNKTDLNAKYKDNTALLLASKKGHLEVVEYLVENGAEDDKANDDLNR